MKADAKGRYADPNSLAIEIADPVIHYIRERIQETPSVLTSVAGCSSRDVVHWNIRLLHTLKAYSRR